MARFYLHVINGGGRAPDEEGVELADAQAAAARAVEGIRSILADEAKTGRMDLDGRIEIADESGAIVRTVPFEDALEIRPGGDRASGRGGG
ncbi:MAG: hypothetical protein QOD42_3154 [Sphingomonadales bacterium]|jgi:hypothetical protein|nr:hypothetical protein [Sphingomonadales bacterium]